MTQGFSTLKLNNFPKGQSKAPLARKSSWDLIQLLVPPLFTAGEGTGSPQGQGYPHSMHRKMKNL